MRSILTLPYLLASLKISEDELRRPGLPLDILVADGLRISGASVGSIDFVKRLAAERADEVGSDLGVLTRMPMF